MVQDNLFQFSALQQRLAVLGMPRSCLSRLAGVSTASLTRIFAGRLYNGKLATVAKVAEAIGLEVSFTQKLTVNNVLQREAGRKAKYVTEQWAEAMTVLHGQTISAEEARKMRSQIVSQLLAGPRKKLWHEVTPIDEPTDFTYGIDRDEQHKIAC